MQEEPLYLINLHVQNFRRLAALHVEFRPGAGLVPISGRNEAGKSTAILAVAAALGAPVAEPIRSGEDEAEVRVTLGTAESPEELWVRRRWARREDGTQKMSLDVRSGGEKGLPRKKPQALLSTLLDGIAIDPFAWNRLSELGPAGRRQQVQQLLDAGHQSAPVDEWRKRLIDAGAPSPLVDIDEDDPFGSLASVQRSLTAHRAEVGRRRQEGTKWAIPDALEDLQEAIEAAARDESGELADREAQAETAREAAELAVRAATKAAARARSAEKDLQRTQARRDELVARIADLQAQLAQVEAELEEERARQDLLGGTSEDAESHERGAVEALERAREEERRVASAVALAAKMRQALKEGADAEARWERIDAACKLVDTIRVEALAKADLPAGLEIDQDGQLRRNGVLYPDGASGEEKITVALEVAMRAAPRLKLLRCDDGNMLDAIHRGRIGEMIRERGYQLLMVTVDDRGEDADGLVIEDGKLLADNRGETEV